MAEQIIVCDQACTVTVQLEIMNPLLNMDTADGALIAGAILAVWAVAFGIRMAIKSLKSTDGTTVFERD